MPPQTVLVALHCWLIPESHMPLRTFGKCQPYSLLYLSLDYHLPSKNCFPRLKHPEILQNCIMLGCPTPGSRMGLGATWFSGRCACPWQGKWNEMIFKVSSNTNHPVILWSHIFQVLYLLHVPSGSPLSYILTSLIPGTPQAQLALALCLASILRKLSLLCCGAEDC